LNKGKTPFECKCQICSATFQFFIDAGENLVMATYVAMPSNPPVALIEKEKFEDAPFDEAPFDETPLDKNVFQRSREEKLSRRMVHTQVDRFAWDHRLFPNPHALAIYLSRSLFLLMEPRQKGLKSVNVKTMMFIFIVKLGFLVMAIIVGYEA
jgi:hypothetical protein